MYLLLKCVNAGYDDIVMDLSTIKRMPGVGELISIQDSEKKERVLFKVENIITYKDPLVVEHEGENIDIYFAILVRMV